MGNITVQGSKGELRPYAVALFVLVAFDEFLHAFSVLEVHVGKGFVAQTLRDSRFVEVVLHAWSCCLGVHVFRE